MGDNGRRNIFIVTAIAIVGDDEINIIAFDDSIYLFMFFSDHGKNSRDFRQQVYHQRHPGRITDPVRCDLKKLVRGKLDPEKIQGWPTAGDHHRVSHTFDLSYKRNTPGCVTKSPIQWRNED